MGNTIHLVFKTHLDIGFTDHAEQVRRQYHERFIPQAIATGEHFFAEDPGYPRFVWTTGAWLIWDHLDTQEPAKVRALEQAIGRGLIRWHALPFTTHSELMSPALFEAGLSYAAELDKRFGKVTTAAKMTDVPGHTRGIVPLLAQAGIKFLHLGVNTASPPPDVPDIFRWRAPEGEEVLVMYQRSYGATHFPEGFDDGLSFAHTSDNIGPQSVPQTVDAYRALQHQHPEATIRAATLDDYGAILWARRDQFPVLDLELGDSWIHGAGTDPHKIARFSALQRLYDRFAGEALTPSRLSFGRGLAMVAEHTWGVDIKSYLRDETAWDRQAFEAARTSDYRFAFSESSWAEQRRYLTQAVSSLEGADRTEAEAALGEIAPPPVISLQSRPTRLELDGWTVALDEVGDITALTAPDGLEIKGQAQSLLGFRYESYDAADMTRHMDSYLTHREEWAILDHDKPGLAKAKTARSASWSPYLISAGTAGDEARIVLGLPEEARQNFGAPGQVELALTTYEEGLVVTLVMRDKPLNRMPEASFLTFTPVGAGPWAFLKTGLWQRADHVARRGGGQLQAVFGARSTLRGQAELTITPLDTPLVAPARWPFMQFNSAVPDFSAGLRFNIHNNKWGTNFPMWWGGDFAARFRLHVGSPERVQSA